MAVSNRLFSAAAMALSLAAGASAQAQSNVQLYGLIDMSVGEFQNAGANKVWRAQSGNMTTSYLGFKGSEDLGGGLKARFAIESFLRADTGESGRFGGDAYWARNAYVGLQGDFGTVTLGRNTTPFFVSTLIFNAIGDSFGFSPSIRQVLTPSTGLPFFGDTGWNNSLLYSSNNYGGLSFTLLGNLGEAAAGATGKNIGGNVLYFAGPLAATFAAQRVRNGAFGTPPGFRDQDSYQFGGSYDFTVVKLFGQYTLERTKATIDTKQRVYGFGASVPIGGGKVLAQYGRSRAYYNPGTITNKTLTVGYDYNLSKSTDVYAMYVNDKLTRRSTGNTGAVGVRMKF